MEYKHIIEKLPYSEPFLFVDKLILVSEGGVIGNYTFKKDSFFYKGHFKDNPITPGVILTECMAQIGLVCLGIYILRKENLSEGTKFVMSSNEIDYYLPVFPGEKVNVVSEKIYFRFQKLKCNIRMQNNKNELIAKGTISGMVLKETTK